MRVMNWKIAKGGKFTIRFAIKLILLCIPIADITYGTLTRMTDAHDPPGMTDWLCELAIARTRTIIMEKNECFLRSFVGWTMPVQMPFYWKSAIIKLKAVLFSLGLLIFMSPSRHSHLWLVGVYRTSPHIHTDYMRRRVHFFIVRFAALHFHSNCLLICF